MSAPNQKIVLIPKVQYNANRLYMKAHIEEVQKACQQLELSELRLWLYLSKNQPGYSLELSLVDAQTWGLPKNSYHRAVQGLIKKGFLIPKAEDSNIYVFSPGGLGVSP